MRVRPLREVVRMTSATIGLIGWSAPGDRLTIPTMTVVTVEIRPVVARVVRARMIKVCGLPVVRIVASIAREGGREMT